VAVLIQPVDVFVPVTVYTVGVAVLVGLTLTVLVVADVLQVYVFAVPLAVKTADEPVHIVVEVGVTVSVGPAGVVKTKVLVIIGQTEEPLKW